MALSQMRKPLLQTLNSNSRIAANYFVRNKSTTSSTEPMVSVKRTQSSLAINQQEIEVKPIEMLRIPYKNKLDRETCDARREWVEQFTGTNLENSASWWPAEDTDPTMLKGNIENCIGLVKIPLARPLSFHGKHADGDIIAPIATTEGVLVAAICRGAKAINLCGGVRTYATHQRMTRAPFFMCANPGQAVILGEWIKNQKERIQEEAVSKHSNHAQLKEIICVYDKSVVHAGFRYETGDAAGQNQTTTCTWHAMNWIVENVPKSFPKEDLDIKLHTIDNNFSGDKKPNGFNSLMGRGVSVAAEADITEEVLQNICGIDSKTFVMLTEYAHRISSRMQHHASFNGNVANILAGIFTAAGQDIGCVSESATATLGITQRDHPDGGVHISMYMPSLVIGTVGGGTALPTQKECLNLMGCYGRGQVMKFAEIICGYCLALDLATWSAVCGGYFADSHEKMGRNRPDAKLLNESRPDAKLLNELRPDAKLLNELRPDASLLNELPVIF